MDLERKHLRLPVESRVFIELEERSDDTRDQGSVVVCRTLDVSAQGLRVAVDQELEEQAYLQIGVEPPHSAEATETFFLIAQVRWCRPGELPEQPFVAGLALMQAQGSDIDHWITLISSLEN
ncbi:PilZ domain-containing protein [Pseudohalioglobus lutimaris]|uniref:PilZ domain-containing protein n=1 Tax=Pseudohalioglobus lutimaris TaxID=1737061 RepID=UPI0013FD6C97|nr:PilZ domain-containing protein [Pseudohalioglobus lutimaris]